MKLNQLRDLVAVAERGSIRAAARALGLAQPALTRSINALERELGVTLFEREARGMRLTPLGERLVLRANVVRDELKRAREELEQLRGEKRGSIAVCLSTVPHIAFLPRALRSFRERFPDVHLDVTEGLLPMVEGALRQGTIDFYVGPLRGSPDVSGLVVSHLCDNELIVCGRKGHPLAKAKSLRQLAAAEWVSTSVTRDAAEDLAPLFAALGLPTPRIALRAHSALTTIVAIVFSDLLGLLPAEWRNFALTRDALQTIDVREPLPAPPICVVRRAGLPLTPAAEHLCDLFQRNAL